MPIPGLRARARSLAWLSLLLASCGRTAAGPPPRTSESTHRSPIAVAGAKERPAPRESVPQGPPVDPSRTMFGGTSCTATDAVELGTSTVRNVRVRATFAGTGSGLVAWTTGEDRLAVRALQADTVGPLVDVELDQAIGLDALGPAGPRGFIAHAVVPLCRDGHGHACQRARGLDAQGSPTGPAWMPEARDQWGDLGSVTSTSDALALALSFRYRTSLDLLRIGASGELVLEPHPIRGEHTGELPIRALASHGARVVAFGVDGDEEDRPFVLALGGARQRVREMPRGSTLVRLSLLDTTATVVFRPEGLRPRWTRVSTVDGAIVEAAHTITDTASLPPDLAAVIIPELTVARRQLVLRRRDLAGAVVGEPFAIAPATGRPVIASAWSGRELAVVWASRAGRTWRLTLRRVRCSDPSDGP